jgi:hypothetical protein
MWFLTQFRRWGLLKTAPDYAAIAARINQTSVWQDAATAVGGSLHHHHLFAAAPDGRHRLERHRPGRLRQPLRHSS